MGSGTRPVQTQLFLELLSSKVITKKYKKWSILTIRYIEDKKAQKDKLTLTVVNNKQELIY